MKNFKLFTTLFYLFFITALKAQTPLSVTVITKNLKTCTIIDGEITINATGGKPPYSYKVYRDGNFLGNSQQYLGLPSGQYVIEVTDVNQNTVTKNVDLLPLKPIVSINLPPNICNVPFDVTAAITNGTSPFQHEWSYYKNNNLFKNYSLIQTITDIDSLYRFQVTDANQCITYSGIRIGSSILNYNVSTTDINIITPTGKITVSNIEKGKAPFAYYLDDIKNTSPIDSIFTVTKGGKYTVKVIDANGCERKKIVQVVDNTLKIRVNISKVNCSTNVNGGAGAIVISGSSPYKYQWSNGTTTEIVENLSIGTHSVTVTDKLGDKVIEKFNISNDLNVYFNKNIPCGATIGSIVADAKNGIPPYKYIWSNGATINTLNNIPVGLYRLTITDSKGCQGVEETVLSSDKKINVDIKEKVIDGCTHLYAELLNGVPPIKYGWAGSNNKTNISNISKEPNVKGISVTDANGCDGQNYSFLMKDIINKFNIELKTCGKAATVLSTCNIAKYKYIWSNSNKDTTSMTFANNGLYSLTVEVKFGFEVYKKIYNFTIDDTKPCTILKGNLFADTNQNCSKNIGEKGIANRIVEVKPGPYYTNTSANGDYSILLSPGDYTLYTTPKSVYEEPCNPIAVTLKDTAIADIPLKIKALCPYMEVDIATWILRRCQDNTYTVKYCNNGTAAAKNAYITIALDKDFSYKNSSIPLTKQQGQTLTFNVGDVAVGECGSFTVTLYLDCKNNVVGQTHCVEAHIYPDSLCTTDTFGAIVEVSGKCDSKDVIFTIKNVGTKAMASSKNYLIIEDEVLYKKDNFKLNPNEIKEIKMPANGKTYRIEAEQEPNYPIIGSKPSAWVEACGNNPQGKFSIGYVNKFPKDDADPFTSIYCRESVASYDPNEKLAFPKGVDVQLKKFIDQNVDLEYELHFQNEGTDTAFVVVLRDTLDKSLNVNSLQVGASSFPYTWEVSGKGILTFTFNKIHLTTKKQNEAKSQGFVKYRIAQQKDVPLGTSIKNRAGIYFDINPVILTNTTEHIVGKDFMKTVGVNTPEFPDVSVKVYPNPFSESIIIDVENLENPSNEALHFYLFDLSGKMQRHAIFSDNKLLLSRENLPQGIYFYQIKLGDKVVQYGKVSGL